MLKKYWYSRTLRTQLLIAIAAINFGVLIIAGVVWVANARQATRLEMEASVELAKSFARVALQSVSPIRQEEISLKISQLSSRMRTGRLRHVRISMADADGRLVEIAHEPDMAREPAPPPPAPAWFSALVAPEISPRTLSVVSSAPDAGAVVIAEQPVDAVPEVWSAGTVVISGEPADEIAEVWYDVSRLALVLAALDLLVLATLYAVLGRMLEPMARVARGLARLEDGDYAARLAAPSIQELRSITDRFNRLAETLGRTRAENQDLYGQLITVQEDERREIANELHDEASPCLFGIMANAMSVQKLTEPRHDRGSADVREHMSEILRITDRLKTMNRVMLKKLRPVSVGRVSLSEIANDLVAELQRRYPDVSLTASIQTREALYGEAIDLALYRCIQEGVTNAIRHGRATMVRVDLFETADTGRAGRRRLELLIQDDGNGIEPDAPLGFGLTAMRERIRAAGGTCTVANAPMGGVALHAMIPLRDTAEAAPEPTEETLEFT